ncbi:MAG: hypothetical protein L6R38_008026 [Xanthoria sp. 2 TBL-2021]|nr:MAG: hypothetical protein L6R38_008026 [Xanthoria sp. 2 TBL-2021]
MPSVPPFSRSERIEDYTKQCGGITWKEERIKAADGVDIALAVASVDGIKEEMRKEAAHVAIVYYQGNGGALPPRLSSLSVVLKALRREAGSSTRYTLVAVSYRGYWTSRGRPSERGIGLDAAAAIQYVRSRLHRPADPPIRLVLWGQSIGAGVATSAAAALSSIVQREKGSRNGDSALAWPVSGLVLETPFVSVRAMLTAIYPQKWLPYRYLGPFLRNHWDSQSALLKIADTKTSCPRILILQAGNDELVPSGQGVQLEETCRDLSLHVQRIVVSRALHNEVAAKGQGRRAIVDFLHGFG